MGPPKEDLLLDVASISRGPTSPSKSICCSPETSTGFSVLVPAKTAVAPGRFRYVPFCAGRIFSTIALCGGASRCASSESSTPPPNGIGTLVSLLATQAPGEFAASRSKASAIVVGGDPDQWEGLLAS